MLARSLGLISHGQLIKRRAGEEKKSIPEERERIPEAVEARVRLEVRLEVSVNGVSSAEVMAL